MNSVELKIKRINEKAQMPTVAYSGSAGLDLYAPGPCYLRAYRVTPVSLGIATEFSSEYVAVLHDRSGMGKNGIHVVGGVFDSDFRGEWMALLYNSTPGDYTIVEGDRVVQVLFHKKPMVHVTEVFSLNMSERGHRGWGSSGR